MAPAKPPLARTMTLAMALPPQFDEPPFRSLERIDEAIDRGQERAFRVLWFWTPPGSVARNTQFQALLASRFLADMAQQALLFGALIAIAREGGGAFEAGLLGCAFLLPGVVLGMYGGAVADALPKRVALAGAYFGMGALTLAIPLALGTEFGSLLLVLFLVRVLFQVSQPSEASTVPLVANTDELAGATSMLGLVSSAGELIGKALLAPVIVRAFGVNPVTIMAGLLFLLSATRVFDLRPPARPGAAEAEPVPSPSTREALQWLLDERSVLIMLVLAGLASTVNVVLGILGPQYVSEVLDVDPANALYVFAPAPIGLLAALAVTPVLIGRVGERPVAVTGFALVAVVMTALGLVAPLSWLIPLDIPGVGPRVETAAFLSIFLGFGVTLAAVATQTYVSRTVPLRIQGRAFALLGVLKDGLAIFPLLALGAVASRVGVDAVITVAPVFLLAIAVGLDQLVSRLRTPTPVGGGGPSSDERPAPPRTTSGGEERR